MVRKASVLVFFGAFGLASCAEYGPFYPPSQGQPVPNTQPNYTPPPLNVARLQCVESIMGELASSLPLQTPVRYQSFSNSHLFEVSMGYPFGYEVIPEGIRFDLTVIYNDQFPQDRKFTVAGQFLSGEFRDVVVADLGIAPDENGNVGLFAIAKSNEPRALDKKLAEAVHVIRQVGYERVGLCFQ